MGPLYKTTVDRYSYRFLNPTDGYPFSVSKINQILNLFVIMLWALLVYRTLTTRTSEESFSLTTLLVLLMSIVTIAWLYFGGRTSKSEDINFPDVRRRHYK